jgi:hypothetical protein
MRRPALKVLLTVVSTAGLVTGCTCTDTGPTTRVCTLTMTTTREEPAISVRLSNLDSHGKQSIWIAPEAETDPWNPAKELRYTAARTFTGTWNASNRFQFVARRSEPTTLGTVTCEVGAGQSYPANPGVTWDGSSLRCTGDWQERR